MKVKEENVPALRFPGFSEEWLRRKLGDTTKIKHGFAFKGQNFSSKGKYIVLTPGNFDPEGGFRYQGEKEKYYISSDFPPEYILEKGDLLTVMTEQAVGLIGSTLIVPESGKFLHNQRLGLFETRKIVIRKFLFHYLKTTSLRIELSKTASGTKVRHTSPKKIESVNINIPSLPEQQKIAAFLTAVDSKIEQLSKKKALLEQYKKGMMQKLFSQELRFKDEQGNDFPDWEERKAGTIFHNHTNKKHDSDLPILAATQDRGVIPRNETGLDIKSSKRSIASYKIIEPGDFVISLRSFQGGIEFSEYLGICSPAYIVLKSSIEITDEYFKFYFKKEDFISRLNNTVIGIRDGKQIPYSSFAAMKLNIPCLSEQRKIATFLSSIDKKINLISTELNQAQSFKKSLLQQMFV